MIASKENDGLGVGSIKELNIALMVKWWWRLRNESSSLWCKVISGIHNLCNKPVEHPSRKQISGVWNYISSTKKDIEGLGLSYDDIFQKVVK